MKALCLMLLLFFLSSAATTARAQSTSNLPDAPTGVAVSQISWRKEIHNPALDEDPF